jgi:multiple sugar transport system permease protein
MNLENSPRPTYYAAKIIIYCVLFVIAVTTVFPFFWAIGTSFKTESQAIKIPPKWIPDPFILNNYKDAWSMYPFARFFLNTMVFSVFGTCGSILICAMAGYALAKYRFRGQDALLIFIVATMMIPFWVNLLPVYMILSKLHWLNTYHGLIVPRLARPFGIFLMRQYIRDIPSDYIEAGRIDGMSEFKIFMQIIMPQCIPVIATLGIFFFLDDWNTLMWPLIVTSRLEMRTITVGLACLSGNPNSSATTYALQMSAATIGALPAIAVFLILQKYIIKGVTLSGIKG